MSSLRLCQPRHGDLAPRADDARPDTIPGSTCAACPGRARCRGEAMSSGPLVSIVDDDESVRESLEGFVESLQLQVVSFESAEAFLASEARTRAACLLLDQSLTGLSGSELQQELLADERRPRIIFITAHADEQFRALVLSRGAIACLPKPFDETELLSALGRALDSRG